MNEIIQPFIEALDNVLVFENGQLTFEKKSEAFEAIQAVSFEAISDEAKAVIEKQLLTDYSGVDRVKSSQEDKIFIQVPKDFKSEEKLYLFVTESEDTTRHIHINLGANATLNVFEYFLDQAPGEKTILESITAGPNSHLDMASLSNFDEASKVTFNRQGFFKENSMAKVTIAAFGDEALSQNTHLKLLGPHAEAILTAISLTSGTQVSAVKNTIEHNAMESIGELNHYGVANDNSFLTFEGVGRIEQGKRLSKNHQHNKGVILSPTARLDANPLLIIDEYDVEAGHGAAIGRIDEEQLYYMMSRGMNKKTAERLIVNGFLHPLDSYLTHDLFKHHVESLLIQKTK